MSLECCAPIRMALSARMKTTSRCLVSGMGGARLTGARLEIGQAARATEPRRYVQGRRATFTRMRSREITWASGAGLGLGGRGSGAGDRAALLAALLDVCQIPRAGLRRRLGDMRREGE